MTREAHRVRAGLLGAALLAACAQGALAAVGGAAAPIPPSVTQFLASITRTSVVAPTTGATAAIRKAQPGALIADSVKLRVSLSSAQFGDVALYAGRAERGVCWVILRGGRVSGNCSGDNVPTRSPVVVGYDANPAGWNLVDGHTYSSKARSLVVHFKSGSTMQVPVSGRFFVFELGLDHATRSQDPPVSLDVRDGAGMTLGTRIDPLRLRVRPKVAAALASTIRLRAQLTLPPGGGRVTLSSGRDAAGDACMRVLLNGQSAIPSFGGAWQCGPAIGRYDHLLDAQNPKRVHRVRSPGRSGVPATSCSDRTPSPTATPHPASGASSFATRTARRRGSHFTGFSSSTRSRPPPTPRSIARACFAPTRAQASSSTRSGSTRADRACIPARTPPVARPRQGRPAARL